MLKEKSISLVLTWQIIGRFILQGIGFITAPVFTRLLTPADYGQVAVYSAWVSLCSLIIGLETHGSIGNARMRFSKDKIDSYFSSVMTISILSFIITLGVVIFANKYISRFLGLRSDIVILLVLQSFATYCVAFYVGKLTQYKQVEQSTLLSLIISILSTGLAILFLFHITGKSRYIVKIYANAIPIILAGVFIIFVIYIKGKKIIDIQNWKYCLSLTLPLILHGMGGMVLAQSDRVMLQKLVGESVAGIYSFAYTVALVISIIWVSFNTTWVPFYYEYKKNNQNDLILLRTKNYAMVFSIITIGFILLSPEVYRIIAPKEYWSGIHIMPMIAVAYYFVFLYSFPANFEFFSEKTVIASVGTICTALINIICNFFFIPLYHEMGAAITTLIAYVFLFVFHEIAARFFVKNYENKILLYFLWTIPVVLSVILFYFTQELWFVRWAIGFILGLYLLRRIIVNKEVF